MIRQLFQNEKLFTTFCFANISLEGVRHFVHAIQPELTAALTVVQIIVGILTIIHVVRKWIKSRNKSHEIIHPDSP